ncbi:MAG: AzlC family ABC transporter permease [Anaerolineae bacterium]
MTVSEKPILDQSPTSLAAVRLAELLAGIKAELPIAVGVVPFGMIFGVLALAAGLSPALAQAMSAIVFAGSAQFIGVQLIGAGSPAAILLLTTFIVNLRHLLYSATLAPHLRHLSPLWRWLLAYLLTDEAFAVTVLHYADEDSAGSQKHWYFLGGGLTLWSFWQASTAAGIFLGAQVPDSWSLDFTLALTFIGLVVPALKDRPSAAAALSAGAAAVLTAGLPFKLELMVAAVTGIIVGVWLENRRLPGGQAA